MHCSKTTAIDNFVATHLQRQREFKAERTDRFSIYNQFNFCRPNYRQVEVSPLQNATCVLTYLPHRFEQIGP